MGAPVHYVGVYESKRADLAISVDVAQIRDGAVLLLDSYSPVKWMLENAQQRSIKAIVVSSSQPGNEVVGVRDPSVRIVAHKDTIGGYAPQARCSCVRGRYECKDSGNLLKTQTKVAELTGGVLASVSGGYAGDAFMLPGMQITAGEIANTQAQQQQNEAERKRCENDAKRGFEQLMHPR